MKAVKAPFTYNQLIYNLSKPICTLTNLWFRSFDKRLTLINTEPFLGIM